MMIGLDRRRRLPVAAGILLVVGFVIAQSLQAAAVRECPHHSGSQHTAVDASADDSVAPVNHDSGAPTPDAPHPGHDAAPDSDADPGSHDGPCDCLGPCGASAAADAPASSVESVFADVAPRHIVAPEATDSGLPRHARSFFLPYPNAPPV